MMIIFRILLIFCPFTLFAQVKITNQTSAKPEAEILFYQAENHLMIGDLKDLSGMKVTAANSEVRINKDHIIIVPKKVGTETYQIYKSGRLISTNSFQVIKIGDPVAQLAFTRDTIISLNRILANPYVTITVPGSLYKFAAEITSFECVITTTGNEKKQFRNVGQKLNDDLLSFLKKVSPGTRLDFDNIKCMSAGGDIKSLPSFSIIVK
jgi:hypothetical protein